jgi:hypothetical protein
MSNKSQEIINLMILNNELEYNKMGVKFIEPNIHYLHWRLDKVRMDHIGYGLVDFQYQGH